MTGKQLMNLLNQLTEAELEKQVMLDVRFIYSAYLNSVQIKEDPVMGKVIHLQELDTPDPTKVIRPTRRAAQRIKKAKKQGGE
jgi:hypothetical protein|tara:strand:+ start:583 stop:831 length:249 start_codon:yes stop_codon:yes gene_type:complete